MGRGGAQRREILKIERALERWSQMALTPDQHAMVQQLRDLLELLQRHEAVRYSDSNLSLRVSRRLQQTNPDLRPG